MKILIVYYSNSGNTEKMANAIAEGLKTVRGVDVELKQYEAPQRLVEYDGILIGTPTYHHNMTNNIKNFLEEAAFHQIDLRDKFGTAFGSYGWSGEAPRLALEIMENNFKMRVIKPPLLIKGTPDPEGLKECTQFGQRIAKQIPQNES
jgi:flavorubredoxin